MKTIAFRLFLALATTWFCAMPGANAARAATNILQVVDRTLVREPNYKSAPKYCLMLLGDGVQVWMVEDGKRLFVDKNANRDLTDDGPPILPSDVRNEESNHWDFKYRLDAITPAHGPRHTEFQLWRWNFNDKEDSYGLSLSVDGKLPMYAGWFGTFWSTNRETAPVLHFSGPFTPKLLRGKEFTIGVHRERLSLSFENPGSGPGAETRLSIDALPRYLMPTLHIEWPAANGDAPLRTTHLLSQRCCYWEFYTTEFEMPKRAGIGKAKISVEFLAPIQLTTTEITAPVVNGTREPDSPR